MQGLTVCRNCGYAYMERPPLVHVKRSDEYMRYIAVSARMATASIEAATTAPAQRSMEQIGESGRALLEEPHRVADEIGAQARRVMDRQPDEILRLDRQIATRGADGR